MNEITNMDLFDALRHRAERESRQLRMATTRADKLNRKVEFTVYAPATDEILIADGLGNVLRSAELPEGTLGNKSASHGKREATGRQCDDLRNVDNKLAWQAAVSRWATCNRQECPNWLYNRNCVDRQRAGTCPALKGRDNRPDTGGVQGARRETK